MIHLRADMWTFIGGDYDQRTQVVNNGTVAMPTRTKATAHKLWHLLMFAKNTNDE
jgi:hypothetical protein